MKKVDVTMSYHQGHSRKPMVNVKVYLDTSFDALSVVAAKDPGTFDDAMFIPWLRDHFRDERERERLWAYAWESGLEDGWNSLRDDLDNVWGSGHGLKVWSAGRSGGWAVVEGLPDIESWDAIALGKWARWCRYTAQQVADVPYHMTWALFHGSAFADYREALDRDMKQAAADAGVVTAPEVMA